MPAGQGPEHPAVASARTLPYSPALHAVQPLAPPVLYVPRPQGTWVALVEPEGQ